MKSLALAAGAAALGLSLGPQAQAADLYGSVGYAHTQTDRPDFTFGSIQGRVGARFGPHLGVEGELAFGVSGDSLSFGDDVLTRKDKLKVQGAIYGVGYLPITPKAELLARIGYGRSEFERDFTVGAQRAKGTVDDDSWNFGVGGQYFFDAANGVRLDYTRQVFQNDLSQNNGDADVWSLAYTRKF